MNIGRMHYYERLRHYEQEKRELQNQGLTEKEYQKRIKELTKKWRI